MHTFHFSILPWVLYIQGHSDFGWRKVMSFNFSVSESSERWYRASNSFPLMTCLRRARGKALVSSLDSWLAGGNSLPRARSPSRGCHCVYYCVWIATLLAVALTNQNSGYAYLEQCTIDYTCTYIHVDLFRPGLVVNDCSIGMFNSFEMSKASVVTNNEVCMNCQRVLISGITDAQHVRWWLLEPTQRYTSTNLPLNIPSPLCALTGVSSPANIHQQAEEKLLLILTESRGFIITEAKRTSTLRSFHCVQWVSVTRGCWFGLDWVRASSCLRTAWAVNFFNRIGLHKCVHGWIVKAKPFKDVDAWRGHILCKAETQHHDLKYIHIFTFRGDWGWFTYGEFDSRSTSDCNVLAKVSITQMLEFRLAVVLYEQNCVHLIFFYEFSPQNKIQQSSYFLLQLQIN